MNRKNLGRDLTRITIATSLLCACGSNGNETSLVGDTPVKLDFVATVAGQPAACGTNYTAMGTTAATVELADARLFLSGIEFQDGNNEWISLQLTENDWQQGGVALLDFEDGSAGCSDSGNSSLHSRLDGQLPPGDYKKLRFTVGVPSAKNHVDVSSAATPLDDPSMFWVWRGGYKHLRVDWLLEGGDVPRWDIHLGSTACISSAPTVAPDSPCGRPNTPTIELELDSLDNTELTLDLANLLTGSDVLSNGDDTPPGCHSAPGEAADCTALFATLGLNFDDGLCSGNCQAQNIFSLTR